MPRCVARTKRRRESRVSVGGLPMVKPLSSNLAGTSGQQLQLRSRCHRVYSSEPSGGAFSARPETLLWRVSARLVRGLASCNRVPPAASWYHPQRKGWLAPADKDAPLHALIPKRTSSAICHSDAGSSAPCLSNLATASVNRQRQVSQLYRRR